MSLNMTDRQMDVAMGLGAPADPTEVSIILPAYNEEDSVDGVYAQVTDVMEAAGYSYEILFVDDGSTDATWPKVKALAESDGRVRGLRHRRNFGKAAALANGFTYARGDQQQCAHYQQRAAAWRPAPRSHRPSTTPATRTSTGLRSAASTGREPRRAPGGSR